MTSDNFTGLVPENRTSSRKSNKVVLSARLSAIVITASNKLVGSSCLSFSSCCCSLLLQ